MRAMRQIGTRLVDMPAKFPHLKTPREKTGPHRTPKVKKKVNANGSEMCNYLEIDTVDLPVLVLQLGAHVDGHVAQVAYHGVHLADILLHLVLAGVVRDAADVTALRAHAVAVIHHPLGLVVHHLAVVVALPCALVLLERRPPETEHQHRFHTPEAFP